MGTTKVSLSQVERLARFFQSFPKVWIDGRTLGPVGGEYAWRSRVSDLRRSPWQMTIENRQRHVRVNDHTITISEYRFVPRGSGEGVAA